MEVIFLPNKYTRWYYNIIKTARSRINTGYTERHHIIPRSLNGSNKDENLVDLTAREHFICHLLLTKMTINEAQRKMYSAVWCMSMLSERQGVYRIKSHTYAQLKENYAISIAGRTPWNKGLKGIYKQTPESNAKRSAALKGCQSPNKGNYGELNPFYGKKHTDPKKCGVKNKGKTPWNKGKKGLQQAWNKGLKKNP